LTYKKKCLITGKNSFAIISIEQRKGEIRMKNIFKKNNVLRIGVIIGTMIIPLLYSYLYLGAFWDPYSKLEDLPVAVVNNDSGALINGENKNMGKEMCDSLKKDASLEFVFTDEKDGISGTEKDDYYAVIVIPEDFSKKLSSASETKKLTADITFLANQKRNYLASQILNTAVKSVELELRGKISAEVVKELSDKLAIVPDSLSVLDTNLVTIKDGGSSLSTGVNKLSLGMDEFSGKINEFNVGINKLSDGGNTLLKGIETLDGGMDQLLNGATKLEGSKDGLSKLTTGSKELSDGAKTLSSSVNQYVAGVNELISSVNSTQTFLTEYVTKINPGIMKDPYFSGFITKMSSSKDGVAKLNDAGKLLTDGAAKISTGAETLSNGSASLSELSNGISQIKTGISSAKEGSKKLISGSKELNLGLDKVTTAGGKILEASNNINSGVKELEIGCNKLYGGLEQVEKAVNTSVTTNSSELSKLDGLSEYVKNPVNVIHKETETVPNYGTAFAPYFLSLSLWVGALIMFMAIYYDPDDKFNILSRFSSDKIKRTFIFMLLSSVQAVILVIALKLGLKLQVENSLLFYLSAVVVSVAFVSIVQFFMVVFKDVGKLISMILLILQLTSCGGTFPMETVPAFFNILYKFMPMTYSVNLFKNAISGADIKEVIINLVVLLALTVVFTTLTLVHLIKYRERNVVE